MARETTDQGGDPPSPPPKKRVKHHGGLTSYVRGVEPFKGLARKPAGSVTPKQLIKMLKQHAKIEACKHEKIDPHVCPYLVEMLNDKRTKCRCCFACQAHCADEI